jgi:hypothetical protein
MKRGFWKSVFFCYAGLVHLSYIYYTVRAFFPSHAQNKYNTTPRSLSCFQRAERGAGGSG